MVWLLVHSHAIDTPRRLFFFSLQKRGTAGLWLHKRTACAGEWMAFLLHGRAVPRPKSPPPPPSGLVLETDLGGLYSTTVPNSRTATWARNLGWRGAGVMGLSCRARRDDVLSSSRVLESSREPCLRVVVVLATRIYLFTPPPPTHTLTVLFTSYIRIHLY